MCDREGSQSLRFKKKRPRTIGDDRTSTLDREAAEADRRHLEEFIRTKTGVEGFLEPRTTVTETTILLVAIDGEWTRRRVASAQWAHRWANKLGVPTYDAAVVGVPQRMRDWNRRQKEQR
jgi:hypothetical protein